MAGLPSAFHAWLCRAAPMLAAGAILGAVAGAAGCDEPPSAPAPTIDIDSDEQKLRDDIKQTRAEATKRLDELAAQVTTDAGRPDGAVPVADVDGRR